MPNPNLSQRMKVQLRSCIIVVAYEPLAICYWLLVFKPVFFMGIHCWLNEIPGERLIANS